MVARVGLENRTPVSRLRYLASERLVGQRPVEVPGKPDAGCENAEHRETGEIMSPAMEFPDPNSPVFRLAAEAMSPDSRSAIGFGESTRRVGCPLHPTSLPPGGTGLQRGDLATWVTSDRETNGRHAAKAAWLAIVIGTPPPHG